MNATYMLAMTDLVLSDEPADIMFLRDAPRDADEQYLAALVASGDYFVTLAVTLEEIAFALPAGCVAQYQLQDIIGQLLRLQNRYEIAKK
ncbi:MAG TPA: hypothetical protein VLF69_02075 [Candidatus Saccharimonadales bacterium]|nr:hypothetical protein [Candidatus Saccharimonadales bacterium]